MACGCAKKNQPVAPEDAQSFAVSGGEKAVSENEVLVRWLKPTVRNVYRHSQVQRARMYNQVWKTPFPMVKADAEGHYKEDVEYVAVSV